MTRDQYDKLPSTVELQYEDAAGFRYRMNQCKLVQVAGVDWIIGAGVGSGLTLGTPLDRVSK